MRGGNTRIRSLLPDIPLRTMSVEIANYLWTYDPETGALHWLVSPQFKVKAGSRAGCVCPHSGYRFINFKKKIYKVSRLVWLLMTGEFPSLEIDHVNGDRSDDRWKNLREANRTQQLANTRTRSDNVLGIKGVHQRKDTGAFSASIALNGQRFQLWCFKSAEEAKDAYDTAAERLFGDFRRSLDLQNPDVAFWPVKRRPRKDREVQDGPSE